MAILYEDEECTSSAIAEQSSAEWRCTEGLLQAWRLHGPAYPRQIVPLCKFQGSLVCYTLRSAAFLGVRVPSVDRRGFVGPMVLPTGLHTLIQTKIRILYLVACFSRNQCHHANILAASAVLDPGSG